MNRWLRSWYSLAKDWLEFLKDILDFFSVTNSSLLSFCILFQNFNQNINNFVSWLKEYNIESILNHVSKAVWAKLFYILLDSSIPPSFIFYCLSTLLFAYFYGTLLLLSLYCQVTAGAKCSSHLETWQPLYALRK